MGMCRCVLVCGTTSISGIVNKSGLFAMRVLMTLMRSLNWIRIYHRKALLAHNPMIMMVPGYTLAR